MDLDELQQMDFRCYVTAAGFNYEATAHATSKTVNIKWVQLDRGMLPADESPVNVTEMVDSYGEQGRFNASVTEDPDNPGGFIVEAVIPADHSIDGQGYVINGAAAVLDNGIIYAYRRVESDYKVVGNGSAKSYILRLRFLPSNAEVINFTTDPSVVLVTQYDLDDAIQTHLNDPDPHPQYATDKDLAAAREYLDKQDQDILAQAQTATNNATSDALANAKQYAEQQDEKCLDAAENYSDQQDASMLAQAKSFAENQDQERYDQLVDFTQDQFSEVLDESKRYADKKDKNVLSQSETYARQQAKDYYDKAVTIAKSQDVINLNNAKDYAKQQDTNVLKNAKSYTNQQVSAHESKANPHPQYITEEQLDSSIMKNAAVGQVAAFATKTPPAGWLRCDGTIVSKTTYKTLYQAIGGNFGHVTPSGFGLPDLRGEFIRGWGNGGGVEPNRGFGSNQDDDFKSHSHTIGPLGGNGENEQQKMPPASDEKIKVTWYGETNETGGDETRPRNVALLYCIKY